MIRRPPRSTLFPTRRSSDLAQHFAPKIRRWETSWRFPENDSSGIVPGCLRRSEEHTSELQSHLNLVCRLLLEKKKEIQGSRRFGRIVLPGEQHDGAIRGAVI